MSAKKILVADDEPHILRIVKDKLSNAGFAVVSVTNGEDALSAAINEKPDLILLDVMMPKMSGFEVCQKIKADESIKHIPVILLTARGQESDIKAGLDAGASEYITKPFSPRQMLTKVKEMLGLE